MPDKFVPIDTTFYSDYYRDLIAKGSMNNYCVDYVDRNRASLLKTYPKESDFVKNFTVTPEIMQGLIDLGTKDEVKYDEEQYTRSKPYLEAILKGLIGRDLYDQSTYYRVVNPTNPIYSSAIEIITSPEIYSSYLKP